MKKILSFIVSLCALVACGTLNQTPEQKAQDEARVQERLDSRRFKVDINFMHPARGGASAVTSPYSLTVNDKEVISFLPYYGVARTVPYGGGNSLNFTGEISEYKELSPRRDRRRFEFVTNNGDERLLYQLDVFGNGKVALTVRSNNRDSIEFDGFLDPDTDPAQEKKE